MKHSITVNGSEFSESLKTATVYAGKDGDTDNGLNYVLLTIIPRTKKMAIIACDGHGYFERRLNLVQTKGQPKPSLPEKEQRLCIAVNDASMLAKFIPSKCRACITINVDDQNIHNNQYHVQIGLPNGGSTTFLARTGLSIPDYSVFCKKAEKSKKSSPVLSNLLIPVHELVRAGKAFPAKFGTLAKIFTCNAEMALLECQTESEDIRVIFTFARNAEVAA